jgi:hypothetical protein
MLLMSKRGLFKGDAVLTLFLTAVLKKRGNGNYPRDSDFNLA